MFLKEVDNSKAVRIDVRKLERVVNNSSSKGNQLKWKHNNMFVKLDLLGYESIAEVMVSYFLTCTDLSPDEYVIYRSCRIYEEGVYLGVGCYSYDYKVGGCWDISSARMMKKRGLSFGLTYTEYIDFLESVLGDCAKEYIDKILCIDSIVRNDDRHFGNINFLVYENRYKPAPIYDNGCACMSDIISYPLDVDFDVNFENIYAKPFRIDFKRQVVEANVTPIRVRYSDFVNNASLTSVEAIRAFETIKRGLDKVRGIAWIEY